MKEFLRRSAIWADALGDADEWPFFDVAARVNPEVRADESLLRELQSALAGAPIRPSVRRLCVAALHWAALVDADPAVGQQGPDPYEPLLLMFERGGGFVTEHGFIELGDVSVRRKDFADHLSMDPVVLISTESLAAADSRSP